MGGYHMKGRLYFLLLCLLFILVGCRAAIALPPVVDLPIPQPPPAVGPTTLPPVIQTGPVKLMRAILVVGGETIELKPHGSGGNTVYDLSGELTFEFNGQVDVSSLPYSWSYSLDEAGDELTTAVSRWGTQIDCLTTLKDLDGDRKSVV